MMNNWFLKIDAEKMQCYPIQLEDVGDEGLESLSPLYREIECDMVERVSLGKNLELWIDEEGMFTEKNAFYLTSYLSPIKGNAILAQYNYKGETHGWESKADVPMIHISDWLLINDPSDLV